MRYKFLQCVLSVNGAVSAHVGDLDQTGVPEENNVVFIIFCCTNDQRLTFTFGWPDHISYTYRPTIVKLFHFTDESQKLV